MTANHNLPDARRAPDVEVESSAFPENDDFDIGSPELASSLLDGSRDVAIDFDPPDHPYVLPDPWGVRPDTDAFFMNAGPVLVTGSGALMHVPLPCYDHACVRCGPLRARTILKDMSRHLRQNTDAWIYTLRSTSDAELRKSVRRVTKAIQRMGGQYIWLRANSGSDRIVVLLSDTDHSTKRGPNPRKCERLSNDEALSYLDYVLWHGIEKRASSQGWKLTDGEWATRGTSDRISIGMAAVRKAEQIAPLSREMYAAAQLDAANRGQMLPDWPEWSDAPPGFGQSRMGQLHGMALAELHARSTRAKR